jgi:hypothetical protein
MQRLCGRSQWQSHYWGLAHRDASVAGTTNARTACASRHRLDGISQRRDVERARQKVLTRRCAHLLTTFVIGEQPAQGICEAATRCRRDVVARFKARSPIRRS